MATTTTNLGLTLPDNGEKVSRQIINTNNTLIDNAFSGVGAKIYDVTLEVSNVSGAYTGTVYDDKITASMRAIDIYAVDPSIFNDKIHVTCYAGYLTITCDDVAGTTDVTISVLKSANDPTALTSTEFDILSNRIGDLDDLTTTVKTNVVNAINEVNGGLATANDHIATLDDKVKIPFSLNGNMGTDPFNTGGNGMVLKCTDNDGTVCGYLVFRPKGYVEGSIKVAIELYNASWSRMWYIVRDST